MKTYPLEQLDLEGAKRLQFRLVEVIARHFDGDSILQAGDYGLWPDTGRPHFTARVEAVLAEFFESEDACLVRGAGTGALRSVLMAALKPGERLVVHQAPMYATTLVTVQAMGLELVPIDFNNLAALKAWTPGRASFALVQHARQRMDDSYNLAEVLQELKSRDPSLFVIVDDNYTALRVPRIGVQLGSAVSAFSLFKLLGPEGLGVVLGSREFVGRLHQQNYSGGTQVQGVEAMEAMRALALAPVEMALQGEVVDQVAARLNSGEVPGVVHAYIANAQSRVVLVELENPWAQKILRKSVSYGAAGHPVGAESRYEVSPLFYRVSGSFRAENPALFDKMIRINPMRAGSDLIMEILARSIQACQES
ncbi:MAG: aminotransferase class V-fold PLP-dependent enzyme [Anaerolineales bacterium]|jgi:hypothetical protein